MLMLLSSVYKYDTDINPKWANSPIDHSTAKSNTKCCCQSCFFSLFVGFGSDVRCLICQRFCLFSGCEHSGAPLAGSLRRLCHPSHGPPHCGPLSPPPPAASLRPGVPAPSHTSPLHSLSCIVRAGQRAGCW